MDNTVIEQLPRSSDTVWRVNGEPISRAEIRAKAAALRLERETLSQLSPGERIALQEESQELLIDSLLLRQEARRLKLLPTAAEVEAALAQVAPRVDGSAGCRAGADSPEARSDATNQLMIEKILETWRKRARRPAYDALLKHYREHASSFWHPDSIHASHIVRHFDNTNPDDDGHQKQVFAEVETLRTQVTQGEPFEAVAARSSDCPENNGDLGWFSEGVMVPEFDEAVFATPAGQLTPVFRTPFGYHFALVHERRASGVRPFAEVRELIAQSLWLQRQDQEVGRGLAQLRSRAVITRER